MTAAGGSDGHVEVDAEIDLDRLEREFGPRLEAIVGRAVQVVDRQFTQLERNVERSSDRIARKIGDGYRDGAKQAVAAIRVLNQQKLEPKIDLDAAKFRRDLKDAHRTGQTFLRSNPLKLRVELENMSGLLAQLTQLDTNLRVDVNQARTAARVAHEAAQAALAAVVQPQLARDGLVKPRAAGQHPLHGEGGGVGGGRGIHRHERPAQGEPAERNRPRGPAGAREQHEGHHAETDEECRATRHEHG